MGRHSQTGLVAAASCEDYLKGIIKKHELTRPDKEDDRVRHIEALNSQTGPVFLVYRAKAALDEFVVEEDGRAARHRFHRRRRRAPHRLGDRRRGQPSASSRRSSPACPFLYIADGHHRSAAAARVFQARKGAGESAFFLTVIFPHNQMQILPYNRVLKDLNGLTPAQLLEKLDERVPEPASSTSDQHGRHPRAQT